QSFLPPATACVWAYTAVPILGIVISARQQFSSACGFNDADRTIRPKLCALSIELDQKMQPFARVCIYGCEQCGVGDFEVGLVKRDLRRVLRESFFEAVALYCAPILGVDGLTLPHQRVNQIGARQVGAVNDDAVSVAAERTIYGFKGKRLRWRE